MGHARGTLHKLVILNDPLAPPAPKEQPMSYDEALRLVTLWNAERDFPRHARTVTPARFSEAYSVLTKA